MLELMKPIDYVIVAAAGQAHRLKPYTRYIPKLLVNAENDNMLTKIVKYWSEYTDRFVFIINPAHDALVRFYLDRLNVRYRLMHASQLVIAGVAGTAHTLYNTLRSEYNGKNVVVTWCDVCPTQPITIPQVVEGERLISVVTHGDRCRYVYDNGRVRQLLPGEKGGNVIGIYLFQGYVAMKYAGITDDLCDVLAEMDNLHEISLDTMDMGDMEKLHIVRRVTPLRYQTRFFNCITELPAAQGEKTTWLLKRSLCPQGDRLIATEMKYYQAVQQYGVTCFPETRSYGETEFEIRKVDGILLRALNPSTFLDTLLETTQRMHARHKITVTPEVFLRDTRKEFVRKIYSRYNEITPLLDHFSVDITHVNGVPISTELLPVLTDLYHRIMSRPLTQYSLIHGDIQFSNALLNDDGKIVFIDPRGYYGDTFLVGHPYYDFSKILYALSGYDGFNTCQDFCIDISNGNLTYNGDYGDTFVCYRSHYEAHGIDWDMCVAMMTVHWLGLAQYLSNDVLKSVAAYHIGLYIYHRYVLKTAPEI